VFSSVLDERTILENLEVRYNDEHIYVSPATAMCSVLHNSFNIIYCEII